MDNRSRSCCARWEENQPRLVADFCAGGWIQAKCEVYSDRIFSVASTSKGAGDRKPAPWTSIAEIKDRRTPSIKRCVPMSDETPPSDFAVTDRRGNERRNHADRRKRAIPVAVERRSG